MTEETALTPTSDERMLSALAHFFGVIAALIIWAVQKDKSRFVRFQAAQAMAFDFAVMIFMGVLFFCLFGVMFLGIFGTAFAAVNNSSSQGLSPLMTIPFILPSLMFLCIVPFSLALLVTRVMATISVLSGNDFHYPILGEQVEKFLAG